MVVPSDQMPYGVSIENGKLISCAVLRAKGADPGVGVGWTVGSGVACCVGWGVGAAGVSALA